MPTPRLNPWPVSIIAFFTVAIIGCVSFVAFCGRHPADLVSADYYERELRYQGQMERSEHALAGGKLVSIRYDLARRAIAIALPPGHPRASGTIELYRPSAMGLDRQIKFEPDAAGAQAIDASDLLPGLWRVRLSWTAGGQDYFLDEKVVIGPAIPSRAAS